MKALVIVISALLSAFVTQAFGESGMEYLDEKAPAPPIPPPATMSVVGEIRAVDEFSQPRLWGEGREGTVRYGRIDVETDLCVNGDIYFGLSNMPVNWAAAAAACPPATWVCTEADVSTFACDTVRPDSSIDGFQCDLTYWDAASTLHYGWLAEVDTTSGPYAGKIKSESGFIGAAVSCFYRPVWCCSEDQP